MDKIMDIPLDLGLSNLGEILGLSPSPKATQPKDQEVEDVKEATSSSKGSATVSSPRRKFDIQTPPELKDLRTQKEQPTPLLPLMVPTLSSPIQKTKSIPSAENSPTVTPHNSVRFADASTDETKEDEVHQVWGWVENYKCMFQLIMGLVIILYGHFFPMTLLVIQAMAITGGPKLQQSFTDLYEHYLHAKQIFEDAMPEFRLNQERLRTMIQETTDLTKKMTTIRSDLSNGKINQSEYDFRIAELKNALSSLQQRKNELIQMTSSVNRVAVAINPTDIQEICISIYLCISAAGAAVSNSVLGNVAMSVKIASSLSESVIDLIVHAKKDDEPEDEVISAQRNWLKAFVRFLATAIGLYSSYYIQEKITILSICTLGAKNIEDSVEHLIVTYVLIPFKLQEPGENVTKIIKLIFDYMGFVILGVAIWAHIQRPTLFDLEQDSLTRWLLFPLFHVEHIITQTQSNPGVVGGGK